MNFAQDSIKSLADLGIQIQKAEQEHRKQFGQQETQESNASRILVDGLISSIYLKAKEPILGITPEGEYQLLLGASFIRTHLLLNNLILDGHIVDSQCLLRKQLEHLARLQELESNTVAQLNKKKTTNIKAAGKALVGFMVPNQKSLIFLIQVWAHHFSKHTIMTIMHA